MAAVQPYLTFDDNCDAAFTFYKSVFGGEFQMFMRFSEMPSEYTTPAEDNKVMHVALPIGHGTILMGSDRMASTGAGTRGDNFSIAISPDSKAEADKLFNGLSAGGTVTMPMDNAPWGAYFGMLVDKFGIQWMVNYDERRQ